MGFEAVVGYAVALSVPVWLVVEQVVSWRSGRKQASPALKHGPTARPSAVPARAEAALSGRAA